MPSATTTTWFWSPSRWAGFTAPLVCERVPVDLLVMLAAMVPLPGESPGNWWANTGHAQAKRERDERDGRPTDGEFDVMSTFFHDVPPEVVAEAMARGERHQSATPFRKPWPLKAWPHVPTVLLLCRVVTQRLGITPDEMDGGHLPALSHPTELVEHLEAYRAEPSRLFVR
jgi:hypothetical protein